MPPPNPSYSHSNGGGTTAHHTNSIGLPQPTSHSNSASHHQGSHHISGCLVNGLPKPQVPSRYQPQSHSGSPPLHFPAPSQKYSPPPHLNVRHESKSSTSHKANGLNGANG